MSASAGHVGSEPQPADPSRRQLPLGRRLRPGPPPPPECSLWLSDYDLNPPAHWRLPRSRCPPGRLTTATRSASSMFWLAQAPIVPRPHSGRLGSAVPKRDRTWDDTEPDISAGHARRSGDVAGPSLGKCRDQPQKGSTSTWYKQVQFIQPRRDRTAQQSSAALHDPRPVESDRGGSSPPLRFRVPPLDARDRGLPQRDRSSGYHEHPERASGTSP